MNQARENFLAGSAFTEKQDRNIDVGHQRCLGADLAHCRAGSDKEHVVSEFLDFATEGLLALAEAKVDDGIQFCFLKWLGEVILRTQFHRLDNFSRIAQGSAGHRCRA